MSVVDTVVVVRSAEALEQQNIALQLLTKNEKKTKRHTHNTTAKYQTKMK